MGKFYHYEYPLIKVPTREFATAIAISLFNHYSPGQDHAEEHDLFFVTHDDTSEPGVEVVLAAKIKPVPSSLVALMKEDAIEFEKTLRPFMVVNYKQL